jgi:1-deoxy-D-xylulose-5-phosphate reductoisomerase
VSEIEPQGVVILGSTGSIGKSTLDVVERHGERFRVVALAARANWQALREQCLRHRPAYAVVVEPDAAAQLAAALDGGPTRVLVGAAALAEIAALPGAPLVMAAIVGAAGLRSTLAAVRAGKRVLLANKESLVMAGPLVLSEAARSAALILPVDSEHNAIFQCLPPALAGRVPPGVRRVLLTASGGPFLRRPAATMAAVTPDEACAHPRWVMGRKISVDSATLMNKGLELIEAQLLFGLAAGQVEVLVHPESIVHSLVEYVDGSVLAQLGNPDMRIPIAHALAWPSRIESGVESLDLVSRGSLAFEAPDHARFPCLGLALAAAAAGGTAPAVLNAANEVAVEAFLGGRLNFTRIAAVIDEVLARHDVGAALALDDVLAADEAARAHARLLVDAGPGVSQ